MRTIKFRVWNPDDLKMEFPLVFFNLHERKITTVN